VTDLAVIFDMDGVLADTEPIHFATTAVLLGRYGVTLEADFYAGCMGMAERPFFELLVERFRLAADPVALARERLAMSMVALAEQPLLPTEGALECLLALRMEGFRLALASSASREQVALVVQRLGLGALLDARVCAQDVVRSKPAPDLFLEAARRLGVPPADCLVVEDAVLGVTAAREAGMRAVALLSSGGDGAAHARAGAAACLRTLRELSPERAAAIAGERMRP
jgi:HAD superfamily hydrolase (TIGR01509 family)